MHPVTKNVQLMITRSVKTLITKGGNFEQMQRKTVDQVEKKYPGLDKGILAKGFHIEYMKAYGAKVS